jgi:YD repeat-containing protein
VKYNGSLIASYSYDELSRRTAIKYGSGTNNDPCITYEYDIANKHKNITNKKNGSWSKVYEYPSYDKVGNKKRCKIDNNNAYAYTYDNLYQLTIADYNNGSSTNYYYDKLGNRTRTFDGTTTNYLRNRLNQYTTVGTTPYSYDNNGNLTNDGTYRYYYDCENRLTDVNDQDNHRIARYFYDFAGRRVKKTVYDTNHNPLTTAKNGIQPKPVLRWLRQHQSL